MNNGNAILSLEVNKKQSDFLTDETINEDTIGNGLVKMNLMYLKNKLKGVEFDVERPTITCVEIKDKLVVHYHYRNENGGFTFTIKKIELESKHNEYIKAEMVKFVRNKQTKMKIVEE